MDEKPVAASGLQYLPVRIPGKGTYTEGNKPFVDFNAVAAGTDPTRRFVHDDRAVANIILGRGIAPPPLTDKGHFHQESSEFWLIMLGKVRYKIETLDEFEAEPYDVVYAPRGMWHLASFGGKEGERSCRLAMNGFPYQAHMYEAD